MNSNSLIRGAQTLVVMVLVLVSLYSFSQTSMYSGLILSLSNTLANLMPTLGSYDVIANALVMLLFLLFSVAIGIAGKQVGIKILCIISFIFFLPSTQPFSRIDWFYFIGMGSTFEYVPSLALTVGCGIILVLCYIALICMDRINDTLHELTMRGGLASDVKLVAAKQIQFTFAVLGCAGLVTALAVGLLVLVGASLEALAVNFDGANLILGIGSLTVISGFVYYYLKKNSA